MNRRKFLRLAAVTAAAGLSWRLVEAAPAKAAPRYDVVVVGAGLGGLSCAALLAHQGLKTLVLEQHYRLGGYATSFPRRAGDNRFVCEVSLHSTVLASPSVRSVLETVGVWDKLELAPHPHAWASRFPDLSLDIPAKAGLDGFEKQLRSTFPGEAEGLGAYFGLWRGIMQELNALPGFAGPKEAFPARFPHLWEIRDKTVGQLVDAHIRDPRVRAVLTQSCGYYGLPPSRLAAFYYLGPTGDYLERGGVYIKGTSQALSDALVQSIRDAGGEVRARTAVAAVLVQDGRAVGVRTADGREYAARAVVSNACVPELFRSLVPAGSLPAKDQARLASLTPSPGSFIVWLGLNRDIRQQFPDPEVSSYPSLDMEANYRAAMACDFEKASFSLMAYDNLIPGFSPAGCSTVSLVCCCGYGHWKPFEADYLAGRKEAYATEKRRLTELLVAMAEKRAIPGLSGMIVMRESATPLTNLRFTRNAKGSIYGYAPTVDNVFLSRLPNRTAVPGLFLASAWGAPGGGYGGVIEGGKDAFAEVSAFLSA